MTAMPVPDTPARPRPSGDRVAEPTTNLKRVRWTVRATLLLGVAASVAANILHANPNLISQAIAAWPPVALLLTVELISRIPVHRMVLAAARLIATTAIAGIAAWVSYWHMAGVAARYGEVGASAYLLPLSVDGLVVVASISLVELSGRLSTRPAHTGPPSAAVDTPPPTQAQPPVPTVAAAPPADPPTSPAPAHPSDSAADEADQPPPIAGPTPAPVQSGVPPNDEARPEESEPHAEQNPGGDSGSALRPRRGSTEQAVIDAYLTDPTQHPNTIAGLVGTSERSVRRYIDRFKSSADTAVPNGANGVAAAHSARAQSRV